MNAHNITSSFVAVEKRQQYNAKTRARKEEKNYHLPSRCDRKISDDAAKKEKEHTITDSPQGGNILMSTTGAVRAVGDMSASCFVSAV